MSLLALLNGIGSIGCSFLLLKITEGLCVVDVTTLLYFTLFTPLVYITFLSTFFRYLFNKIFINCAEYLSWYIFIFSVSQSSIMFSYKAQNDERIEEDTVSLPHQPSFSSLKTDSDYIYQVNLKTNCTTIFISYALYITINSFNLILDNYDLDIMYYVFELYFVRP